MSFVIQLASAADIYELDVLINACYIGSSQGWTSVSNLIGGLRTTPTSLQNDFSNPNLTILKCVETSTGNIVASCHARQQNDVMLSEMLCVSPTKQGQGVGKLIILEVENLAAKLNCKIHKIEVFSCRASLIEWYERMGFKKNGQIAKFPEPSDRDWYPKMELELIEMEKEL